MSSTPFSSSREVGMGGYELICSLASLSYVFRSKGNLTRKFKSDMYLFPREDSSLGVVPRYILVTWRLCSSCRLSSFCSSFPPFPRCFPLLPPRGLPRSPRRSSSPSSSSSCCPTLRRLACPCLPALRRLVVLPSCFSSSCLSSSPSLPVPCRLAVLLPVVLPVLVVFPSCSASSCLSSARLACPPPRLACPPPRLACPLVLPVLLLSSCSSPRFLSSSCPIPDSPG